MKGNPVPSTPKSPTPKGGTPKSKSGQNTPPNNNVNPQNNSNVNHNEIETNKSGNSQLEDYYAQKTEDGIEARREGRVSQDEKDGIETNNLQSEEYLDQEGEQLSEEVTPEEIEKEELEQDRQLQEEQDEIDQLEDEQEENLKEEERQEENAEREAQEEDEKEAEEADKNDHSSTAKAAKVAAKGAATYFAGPIGSQAVDTIAATEPGKKVLNETGEKLDKVPGIKKTMKQLDDQGALDAADAALDAINGDVAEAAEKAIVTIDKKQDQADNTESESEKDDRRKKKLLFIILILFSGLILLILIIMIILLLLGGGSESLEIDSNYNFNQVKVAIPYYDPAKLLQDDDSALGMDILEVDFPDYVMGVVYYEYKEILLTANWFNISLEEHKELIKALLVAYKTSILFKSGYDGAYTQMVLPNNSEGFDYCDIYSGCIRIGANAPFLDKLNIPYAIYSPSQIGADIEHTFSTYYVQQYEKMSDDLIILFKEAYEETKNDLILPADYDDAFPDNFDSNIATGWVNSGVINNMSTLLPYKYVSSLALGKDVTYEDLLELYTADVFGLDSPYQLYHLQDHVASYEYSTVSAYWWPIGSNNASSDGNFGGAPASTRITSEYGFRVDPITGEKGTMHNGIDIGASCGVPVIATRPGTVKNAEYSSSCGYFVKIDHGDGTFSRYCHMQEDSLTVQVGDTVKQGQKIGNVGSTGKSTGCHLHFEVWDGSNRVNPLDYVSPVSPRPSNVIINNFEEGTSNPQSVCLTLKSSGFSNEATAAIMANIHSESGFKTGALGDSGTSYGLCQWHNTRKERLESYCGAKVNSVECQVDYLINELQSGYKGVYNTLLSSVSPEDMTVSFCRNFERPANANEGCQRRADNNTQRYYNYVKNGCQ